jgi:hypothetical protein
MLGLSPDSVRSTLAAQMAARQGGGGDGPRQSGEPVGTPVTQAGRAGGPGGGQGVQMPEVSDKDCGVVTAAMAKKPAEQAKLDALRQQMMSGAIDRDAMRTETQKIYAAVGVDARVAAACRRRTMQNGGGAPAGAGFQAAAMGSGQGGGARRTRPGLVFVKTGETFEPRLVMLGSSNFDYTEVVSGLKEGEQVAMLAAAALQAQRLQNNDRIRQQTGVPGMQQQPAGGAGGAAGARPGGAGGAGGGGAGGGRAGGGR